MKAGGILMLLLAFFLVAMPAVAVTPVVTNGALALTLGTKIIAGEEVGALVVSESVIAPAVSSRADGLQLLLVLVSLAAGGLMSLLYGKVLHRRYKFNH